MAILNLRVFDRQNDEAVPAFVIRMLEFEGVIEGKVVSAEVTE